MAVVKDEKTLVVPSDKEPTYWNRDAAFGAAGGTFVPVPGAMLLGALIGAVTGKSRMEKEQRDGKEVNPPTFWNKTTAIGAAIGSYIGVPVAILAGGAAMMIAAVATGTVEPVLEALTNATGSLADGASTKAVTSGMQAAFPSAIFSIGVGGLAALAAGTSSTIAGALIGGRMGKERLAKEYEAAQAYHQSQSQENGKVREQQQGYTVTPQQAAELESRLSDSKAQGSHVERLQAQQGALLPTR